MSEKIVQFKPKVNFITANDILDEEFEKIKLAFNSFVEEIETTSLYGNHIFQSANNLGLTIMLLRAAFDNDEKLLCELSEELRDSLKAALDVVTKDIIVKNNL